MSPGARATGVTRNWSGARPPTRKSIQSEPLRIIRGVTGTRTGFELRELRSRSVNTDRYASEQGSAEVGYSASWSLCASNTSQDPDVN